MASQNAGMIHMTFMAEIVEWHLPDEAPPPNTELMRDILSALNHMKTFEGLNTSDCLHGNLVRILAGKWSEDAISFAIGLLAAQWGYVDYGVYHVTNAKRLQWLGSPMEKKRVVTWDRKTFEGSMQHSLHVYLIRYITLELVGRK